MRTSIVLRSLAVASLLGATSCAYPYTTEDAGDGAWVEQVVPALLGRKPINAVESRVLVDIAHQKGRDAVVDVLLSTPDFEGYWSIVLADMLKLQRGGSLWQDAACWNSPSLYPASVTPSTALAAALSTQVDPTQSAGLGAFNMADVLRSAIARDDLFAPFRAQLFSLGYHGRQHPIEAQAVFLAGFVNRQQSCLQCHTSTSSAAAISPIPMDIDGSLFGSALPATVAGDLYYAFSEAPAPGPSTPVLGSMSTTCASILQSSQPDAHHPQAPGGEFAGLDPASHADYDVADLDAALMAGHASLTADDLATSFSQPRTPGHWFSYQGNPPLDGDKAFAAALALSATEAIIKELEGHGLTLPHGHPRVDEQRYYLQGYAYTLVSSSWSLRYLLKSLVLRGTFNMVPPSQAASAYPFPMFFNGWARNDTGASGGVNGQGDLVHRFSVPALLTSVHHSLGWPAPKVSPLPASVTPAFSSREFQRDLGRHESVDQPGKDDVDFQSLLSWEDTVGMCRKPTTSYLPAYSDWVDQVVAAVNAPNASFALRDVVIAFKDRLIQEQEVGESVVMTGPAEVEAGIDPGQARPVSPGMSWDDPAAVVSRTQQEARSVDLRQEQRDAAGVIADEDAARQARAEEAAALEEPAIEPRDAWRERFDGYEAKLEDPAWTATWRARRDALEETAAVKLLDSHGLRKGYWKGHVFASEADLLASYFGVSSLGYPAALVPDLANKLRGYCGTLLTSPQFMLGGMRPAQAAAALPPALLVCLPAQSAYCDEHQLCALYATYAAAHGHGTVTCP